MYIAKIVTVSSTAIIATVTDTPLRTPGPSDTPIFSVVSPPSTTLAAPIRLISVPSMITTTAMATITMTAASNSPPYPAFNASNYPSYNVTSHQEDQYGKINAFNASDCLSPNITDDHEDRYGKSNAFNRSKCLSHNFTNHRSDQYGGLNKAGPVPIKYSNGTNKVPVVYRSGNQTFTAAIYPSDPKDPRIKVAWGGQNAKDKTEHARLGVEEVRSTGVNRERPTAFAGLSVPSVGAGGMVYEQTLSTRSFEGKGSVGGEIDSRRGRKEERLGNGSVPAYVKALERGPII